MNFFKLFVFAVLLFCGTFAQRFQRHALMNGTHDELINGTTVNDVEELAFADGSLVKQIGDDLNLVGDGDINIQLDNDKELKFEHCSTFSSNCLGEIITVRYDAQNPVSSAQGHRGSGQCEFKSEVMPYSDSFKILMDDKSVKTYINENGNVCAQATMKFPKAIVPSMPDTFTSCNPIIYDGNMVKVSVTGASSSCYLTVKHAKQWFPPSTTPSPTAALPIAPPAASTTEASLSAGTTAAIAIGCIFGVIALIAIIVIIICCYRDHKKKKSIPRTIEGIPVETALAKAFAEENIVGGKGKAEVKKETTPKPDGKDKKEAAATPVEKEAKAKKHPKQSKNKKAAVQEKQPIAKEEHVDGENAKVSKVPVEEDHGKKVSTEPTHEDPKPGPTFKPFALVPTDAVHPIPKAYRVQNRSSSLSSLKSGRKDSLSERNDIYMAMVVEMATRIIGAGKMDLAAKLDLKAKMDVFGLQTHVLEPREIGLFCCSLELMFIKIEMFIDEASAQMEKLGCTMDKFGSVVELSRQAKLYFADPATPAFIRCYAFGGVFGDLIDQKVGEKPIMSIQLLFIIALQRRYSLANRQHALTFIRKELPIVKEYYFAAELRGFPFPINAIEEAVNLDPAGFNLALEDATQASRTRKSEKKDKSGKKKNHQAKK